MREKRLFRFYLNGKDAFRLVLVVPPADDEDSSGGSGGKPHPGALSLRFLAPPRMVSVSTLSYDSDDDVSTR